MKGKKKYQVIESEVIEDNFVSRSQKKRDSTALQKIGEQLVKLKTSKLNEFNISEEIQEAILQYNKLADYEARRRQMQFIGKLIREDQNFNAEEIIILLKQMG